MAPAWLIYPGAAGGSAGGARGAPCAPVGAPPPANGGGEAAEGAQASPEYSGPRLAMNPSGYDWEKTKSGRSITVPM